MPVQVSHLNCQRPRAFVKRCGAPGAGTSASNLIIVPRNFPAEVRKNFNNCELNGGCADVSLIEIPHSCTGARQAPSTRVTRSFQAAFAEASARSY